MEMHKELVLARTRHPGMKYSFEKDHNSEEKKKKRVTVVVFPSWLLNMKKFLYR